MPSADQVPVKSPHSTMRWHKWVVLIAGSTGSALRAVRPPNLHITPDVRRDLVYAASASDAQGLRVHERPYGRISGLNCWEHKLMLPGYALAAQGTQIHVAAWPGREPAAAPPSPTPLWPRQLLLSRAFASQAGCYVIAAGGRRLLADTPERYRGLATVGYTGDSFIIDP